MPECFWKGVGNPNFAQLAGVIDETYRTGVSFGQFGKFVMPLSNIDDLLRDYLLGITCEDELWDNIKKIDKLEDEIRKLDYDSELINFVVDKWKNEQIETLAEDISACEEYIKFKKKVPIYADIVLNWDKWVSGFDALHANIDKYVETFAKDLGNVGTLNDLQNYAIGKRMFEVGSIFATAGRASPAEVGINTLKKLPKLPKNIPLRAIEHTATEVKVIAEGQTTSLFTVSKEGVYTSERWFTGTGVITKLDEVTNVHFMERGSNFKTGTIEFVEDANGEKWLKATTTASRYANYPNIQKLATHVLDEVDNLADDLLATLEADLTGNDALKTAFESDASLVNAWGKYKTTNIELLKKLKLDNIVEFSPSEKNAFEQTLNKYFISWKNNSNFNNYKDDIEGLLNYNMSKGIGGVQMEDVGGVVVNQLANSNGEIVLKSLKATEFRGTTQTAIAELDFVNVKGNQVSGVYSAKYDYKKVNIPTYKAKLENLKSYIQPTDVTKVEISWDGGKMSLHDFQMQYLNNTELASISGKGVVLKNSAIINKNDYLQLPLTKDEWLLEFTKAIYKRY